MVHSSLSACGFIRGGAPTVIRALRAWNPEGTLAMPAHSYCYPDAEGHTPVFDPVKSRSRVGTITDAFWRQPGVFRSLHPSHSLACEGPAAAHLVEGHELCETPCGAGTPYDKLVRDDAAVLMFGVTLDALTLLHTAEDAASVPYLYEAARPVLKMKAADGSMIDFPMKRQNMKITRRFSQMDTWLETRGLLLRQRLGRGELLLMPHASLVHASLVSAMRADPWLLVADTARPSASHP
jgi:aminoglycoside 3-N-acetyltransferase